jgi:hypothetical protein
MDHQTWAGREQRGGRGGRRRKGTGKEGSAQEGRDCSGLGGRGITLDGES